jgi:hypothetical protein
LIIDINNYTQEMKNLNVINDTFDELYNNYYKFLNDTSSSIKDFDYNLQLNELKSGEHEDLMSIVQESNEVSRNYDIDQSENSLHKFVLRNILLKEIGMLK